MSPRLHSGFKVLVVDDDPSVLATYRRLLRRAGFHTITEADPLKVVGDDDTACQVDLLLLDHKMPGMDGLTLLAELRRRECRARCILISAYLNDDVRCQARNLGVDRMLEKPVDIRALRRAINELLPVLAAGPVELVG